MYKPLPKDVSLWQHQEKALKFLIKSLKANRGPCLLRMPTGTGKTGVIACLSLLCARGRTLVLTPWSNLRDQMVDELEQGFWSSIGRPPPQGKVVKMIPSSASDVLADETVKVIICTFTTLTALRRDDPVQYQKLAAFVNTAVVDECHYEPAVEWGRAVKGLAKPMALLTATPYRNDLKLFRIRDTANVFHFTHEEAESEAIIRRLAYEPLTSSTDIGALSREFVQRWKEFQVSNQLSSASPRAIICCAGANEIRMVVLALKREGIDAIGIHEQFVKSSESCFVKNVPSKTHSAQVWVHQNKLTEGFDDYRFCCLVFTCNVGSDRKLIQQIGRVLRSHKSDARDASAVMMAPPEFELSERWLTYRAFEKNEHVINNNHFRQIVEEMLARQPEVEYFGGRFRKRFRTDILSENPQVIIAPSVLIRKVQAGFKLVDYIEDCTDSLNLTDAIILGDSDGPCQRSSDHALWVYASVDNSRILGDASFYEVTLEAHCVVVAGEFLLISDTTGTFPEALLEEQTIGVGASNLAQLMDASYRVTNIATSSAVPFDTVLRASEHRGHDLNIIPSSLTDRVQICRAARGAKLGARRYLGLHRGRVREELSERKRQQHSVTLFREWAQSIGIALEKANKKHPVLQRYMQPCTPPSAPVAVSMSIDLSQSSIAMIKPEGASLILKNSSVDVLPSSDCEEPSIFNCEFDFLDDSTPQQTLSVPLSIEFQQSKGRFWIKSRGTIGVYIVEANRTGDVRKSLAEFLNQNQELILIGIGGGDLVYQGKNFYSIDYSHAERSLLDQIVRPEIDACANEKGTAREVEIAKKEGAKATEFIEGSLFKRIAEAKLPLDFTPELVICDDLGSECADFVLANFDQKALAFVHAKAGNGAGISASAFHDIVSQAMKNLVYLTQSRDMPSGTSSWNYQARWNNTDIPRLYLAPADCPTGEELWNKLRGEIIMSPNARLHVVLATTGCCDLNKLEGAIADPAKRTAETAQLLHLLDGLIGYARQLGVQVSIFDVPFKPKRARKASAKSCKRKSFPKTQSGSA